MTSRVRCPTCPGLWSPAEVGTHANDQLVRLGFVINSVITEGTAGAHEFPAQTEVEAGKAFRKCARRDLAIPRSQSQGFSHDWVGTPAGTGSDCR
jgi:hypothetical protein